MMGGARRTVNVGLLDPEHLTPGSWVMVHAGLALAAISAEEAHETLALLQEMRDAFADQTAAAGGG